MAISIQMARLATFLKPEQDAMINTLSARSLHFVSSLRVFSVSSSVSARPSHGHLYGSHIPENTKNTKRSFNNVSTQSYLLTFQKCLFGYFGKYQLISLPILAVTQRKVTLFKSSFLRTSCHFSGVLYPVIQVKQSRMG